MNKSLADSEKLYEEVKKFFYDKDEYDFVIEISDRSMSEWKLTYVLSLDEMIHERIRLRKLGVGFAGFFLFEGTYEYYFSDECLFKSEDIRTGEVLDFDDRTFNEFNMKKVAEELRQLMAHKVD